MAAVVTEFAVGITWNDSTAVATEEFDGGWIRRMSGHRLLLRLFASLEEKVCVCVCMAFLKPKHH